jgi:uncharacterized protein DUF3857/transglutaminase superfamily protein
MMLRLMGRMSTLSLMFGVPLLWTSGPVAADDWPPIDPDELRMTSEPKDPLASTICLYRQEDTNDVVGTVQEYSRVKILSEAGRNNANIKIDYYKSSETFRFIRARTIHPDGTVVNFDGTVYDTPVKVGHGSDLYAKTFTLQGVEVGSIIEYRYLRETRKHNLRYQVHWILSQDMFTKSEKFSLLPATNGALKVTLPAGLPEGTDPPRYDDNRLVLEAHDIPAYVVEEQMPPENAVRSRVDFAYVARRYDQMNPVEFWNYVGRVENQHIEFFVDRPRAMEKALRQIVSPTDSAETRLKKIYDRVQQFNNSSYERKKTEEEARRDYVTPPQDVEGVWQSGHGTSRDIPWLFLALARAAGFRADPVLASGRNYTFFDKKNMNPAELESNLVVVNLDGKDLFLDPGDPYAPFGQLTWYKTAVTALRLNSDGGTWVQTPLPAPAEARVERRATLKLDSFGTLSGRLVVTYVGSEATWRRIAERQVDAVERRKFLEDEVKASIPAASEVTLANEPAWGNAEETLVADFDLRIEAWADVAGRRMLLPVEVFGGEERHLFEHARRVQPVYFDFPFMRQDDVSVTLPERFRADIVPHERQTSTDMASYKMAIETAAGGLRFRRDLTVKRTLIKVDAYDSLRNFYQAVRAGDEQHVVLSGATGAGTK